MSSYQRPYQGYPYVNPTVTDVPSISAVEAARWNNLPRRQVVLNVTSEAPARLPERLEDSIPVKRDSNPAPVVYIDLPEGSGSDVADRNTECHDFEVIEPQASKETPKRDPDAPVLYIEVPEAGGSVTQSTEQTIPEELDYFQETIFYDQFENRRIDRSKQEAEPEDESEEGDRPSRPAIRPTVLSIQDRSGASSSARALNSLPSSSGMSSLMSKEAEIYAQTDSNGFPASPIPISQFPEPPPAYAELDNISSPVVEPAPVMEQPRAEPRPEEPPRTQVIVREDYLSSPTTSIGMLHPDRKFLNCQHCGIKVHTLVISENGTITHVTAAACCLLFSLLGVMLIYCTNYVKIKNHYCPNCNRIICCQRPMSKKIVYVN